LIAPGINGSNGVLMDGTPVTLRAPIDVPWYARKREITFVRDGWPISLKYCRTNLIVVSMASPPDGVRNTRLRSPGPVRRAVWPVRCRVRGRNDQTGK
jgi:hypothetical protein